MIKIVNMKLESMTDVQEFVNNNCARDLGVFVRSGSFLVNGKSILGILSLDLSNIVDVQYDGKQSEINSVLDANEKFIVGRE